MYTREQLTEMKRPELNPIAKELGLSTAVSIKNADLIDMIIEKQDNPESEEKAISIVLSLLDDIDTALINVHKEQISANESTSRIKKAKAEINKLKKLLSPLA